MAAVAVSFSRGSSHTSHCFVKPLLSEITIIILRFAGVGQSKISVVFDQENFGVAKENDP